MRQSERTRGIVLRRFRTGEADRALIIFTRDLGKLRARARSIRRTTSKLGGHLEPLQEGNLSLARGSGEWWTVTAASLERSFRLDLGAVGRAARAAELTEALMPEAEPSPETYDALLTLLARLEAGGGAVDLLRFELRLFGLAGLAPELASCVVCRRELGLEALAFSAERGGALHRACLGAGELSSPISAGSVGALREIETAEPTGLAEVNRIWDHYVSYSLKRALRSQVLGADA